MSATTGIPTIDYLISDPRQTPDGVDPRYVERIVRLPDCYVCHEPPAYAPPVGPLPALRNGYVTYGCFNNLAKIDEASVALGSTPAARPGGPAPAAPHLRARRAAGARPDHRPIGMPTG